MSRSERDLLEKLAGVLAPLDAKIDFSLHVGTVGQMRADLSYLRGLLGEARSAIEAELRAVRVARVYCGNSTRWRGFFEDPEECSWEGDVPLPECPEEDALASWVCPGCGATNSVRDHAVVAAGRTG